MGMSRIEIAVVGNHGCGRDVKEGEDIKRCGASDCIDCQAQAFVGQLRVRGASINAGDAVLRHWPDDQDIHDDLVTGKRVKGSF